MSYQATPTPRNLRVRSSVQLGGQRLPVRTFIFIVGVVFGGVLLLASGASLTRIAWLICLSVLVGVAWMEGQLWGRSAPQLVHLLARHAGRSRRLRLRPLALEARPRRATSGPARAARWAEESSHA